MSAPSDPSQAEASAPESRETRPAKEGQSCCRCGVIRLFVFAAISIAILQLLAPSTFAILHGVSSLSLSLVFVGGLGIISILKSLAEYLASQSDNPNKHK